MNLDYSLLLKYKFLFATAVILIILVLMGLALLLFSPDPSTQNGPSPTPFAEDQNRFPSILPGESGNMTPEEAADAIKIKQQGENAYQQRLRRLPFIAFLPYQTPRYLINIAATTDTVTVTTYGTTAEEHLRYRQEALSWLRANGANVQTLLIRYEPAGI